MPPHARLPIVLPADWVTRIAESGTMDQLNETVADLAAAIGFRAPTYGLFVGPEQLLAHGRIMSGYPAEWVERYMNGNYAAVDPVVQAARVLHDPFAWNEMPADLLGPRQIAHMREAADFGIADGLAVPVRSPGVLGVFALLADGSRTDRAEALHLRRDSATALALGVHEHARRLFRQQPGAPSLTARERECVQWLAVGKSGPEIGDILGISELTVTQHLKSAMRKLGVYNRVHLAVKAVTLGLVEAG